MKKKFSFKLCAMVLALVICLVPMLTVLANAGDLKTVPIISVHGLMASDIYIDPTDPDSELAWPPSGDAILEAVKEAVPSIAKLALTKNWDDFGDDVCEITTKLFSPIYCQHDGTAGKSGVRFKYPAASSIKKDSIVDFKYDWRIDPIVVAGQLNDYIDYVLKCSGCDTVKICCHSLGGVITNTYLTLYGDSKISGVCFNSTAIFGQTYVGELMNGQIVLDADALHQFLEYVFDYNEYKDIINGAMDILKQAGLFDFVCGLGNEIVDHILVQASREVLAPMFGGWLSIWAMTRDEDIEQAQDFFFNTINDGIDYSEIEAKINNFNTTVRPYKAQTLKKLNENASVYVISRYDYPSIPITPSFNVNSDGVVDVHSTSFGATVAPYGSKLSDEQIAGVDAKYISPDRTINASTCMFPEQTWFIKDMQHANNPDSLEAMMYKLLRYDGQATVDTFEGYQRFSKYDSKDDVIYPYQTVEPAMTFTYRIKLIVKEFISLIRLLIEKISAK